MKMQRIPCGFGIHRWVCQYPYSNYRPTMMDKRWCSRCGQVEYAYEIWKGTDYSYYSFDRWVREEDWYKLSYIKDPRKPLSKQRWK